MEKGVKIFLVEGTKIPKWMLYQSKYVIITKKEFMSKPVIELIIKRGHAEFIQGGNIEVITPAMDKDSDYFAVIAFEPLTVIQIVDLEGGVLAQNYYFCPDCLAMTGVLNGQRPGKILGKPITMYKCSRCGNEWENKKD